MSREIQAFVQEVSKEMCMKHCVFSEGMILEGWATREKANICSGPVVY